MKYCVSIRQKPAVLRQADEFFVLYKDFDGIYNFDSDPEFFNKKFIIQIPYYSTEEIKWDELAAVAKRLNIVAAVEDIQTQAQLCNDRGIPFYWNYPITSYDEVHGAISSGVCELKLGAPLFFDLERAASLGMPIRLAANICHSNLFPNATGFSGTYIRPEDVKYYEPYVKTLEFVTDNLHQEEGLLRVYKNGIWNGNLNLLLTNLNWDIDNRALPDDFGFIRTTCRQRCLEPGKACTFCSSIFNFADSINRHRHDEELKAIVRTEDNDT